jgi:hypothetical protein
MSMVFLALEFSWVISCIILLQNTSVPDTGFIFIWGQSLKYYFLLHNDVTGHPKEL